MKRGFTLVEVLGVVALLGIIVAITYPTLKGAFNTSKEKLNESQKNSLENIAKAWGAKNTDEFSETQIKYVTIDELKRSGLLEQENGVIDLDTQEALKGCIKIEYNSSNNQYAYTYDIYEEIEGCH